MIIIRQRMCSDYEEQREYTSVRKVKKGYLTMIKGLLVNDAKVANSASARLTDNIGNMRKMPKKYTEQLESRIEKLYKAGNNKKALGRALGINPNKIQEINGKALSLKNPAISNNTKKWMEEL